MLAALKPLGPGLTGHLTIDDFRVVEKGETAEVTHEDDEYLDYHGQVIRSRFRMTDTWIHSSAGWKLLASQVLAVLKDPPVRKLDAKVLCSYSGTYELTADIKGTIRCENDELIFERSTRGPRHRLATDGHAEVKRSSVQRVSVINSRINPPGPRILHPKQT